MIPRIFKTENLAPVRPGRKTLHEMACAFAEEQFKLKGRAPFMWLMATGSNVAWIETNWSDDHEKRASTYLIRDMLQHMHAQAYSFITEAWVGAFTSEKFSADEVKHWTEFSEKHGVSALPPHMRDDVLMIFSYDRDGPANVTRYLVNIRERGPNYLGVRVDEEQDLMWSGRMGNLFMPERRTEDVTKAAMAAAKGG